MGLISVMTIVILRWCSGEAFGLHVLVLGKYFLRAHILMLGLLRFYWHSILRAPSHLGLPGSILRPRRLWINTGCNLYHSLGDWRAVLKTMFLSVHQMLIGHDHPIWMGCLGKGGTGTLEHRWHNLGFSVLENWPSLVSFAVAWGFEVEVPLWCLGPWGGPHKSLVGTR